ncbi:MAG: DegT/DnrJ/EryC1/StrS family aminotransferase [Aggregatilineales bacterium]
MIDGHAFRVPRSRVFETHASLRDAISAALEPVLFGSIADGYAVRAAFEDEFASVVGQRWAVSVASGTIGLLLALRACGIGPGDEVITVGNSDISTTAAVRQCGATPVLCDVLASDYTIDPDLVETRVTPRTRALLPVDLYGHPADGKRLRALADRHGLKIIEDAALAAGAEDHGQPVGAYADATVFSFAPFKPLGSVGNGGIVVTNDPEIGERLQLFSHYGHALHSEAPPGHQHYVEEGYNVVLDPLQAALLRVKLAYLPEWTARRRAIARAYHDGLAGTAVQCPSFRAQAAPTFRSYTVCVPRREAIYARLREAGVEAVIHYAPAIYRHPVYDGWLPGCETLPVTDRLARSLLCLPVAPELTDDDIAYAIAVLRDAVEAEAQ